MPPKSFHRVGIINTHAVKQKRAPNSIRNIWKKIKQYWYFGFFVCPTSYTYYVNSRFRYADRPRSCSELISFVGQSWLEHSPGSGVDAINGKICFSAFDRCAMRIFFAGLGHTLFESLTDTRFGFWLDPSARRSQNTIFPVRCIFLMANVQVLWV